MRTLVTILGLSMTFLVVACGSNSSDERPTKPAAPVVVEEKCVEVTTEVKGQAAWLNQLPPIIQFKMTPTEKEGVVAEPLCVRDRDHAPDWDDVVSSGPFGTDSLEVGYARSVDQLESIERFAKLQELSLNRRGRKWVGKLKEVAKQDRFFDQALDYFLPIEREVILPSCKTEEMNGPVEVPRSTSLQCH